MKETKNNTRYKTYRQINFTLLLFDIFIITYPLFAYLLNFINPKLTKCPYNEMTGELCPFCGGTRMIKNIWHGSFHFEIVTIPTLVIVFYAITNIVFRLIYLNDKKLLVDEKDDKKDDIKDSDKRNKIYMIIDIITGSILALYVAFVIIPFIITNIL